jgi:hypothetical protein
VPLRDQTGSFDLDSATVELAIGWETNKKGGIDFQVFKMGGGITRNNRSTLTVTVRRAVGSRPETSARGVTPSAGQQARSRPPRYPVGDTGHGPQG